jgi:hypothetical protein
MERMGRAAEKTKAKQLTEPRLGTEWLDKFSIDKEKERQEKQKRVAEEKEKKKRVREEKRKRLAEEKKRAAEEKKREAEEKSLTYTLTVIPGESDEQREERLTRWEAVEGPRLQRERQHIYDPALKSEPALEATSRRIHAASKLEAPREATSRRIDRKRQRMTQPQQQQVQQPHQQPQQAQLQQQQLYQQQQQQHHHHQQQMYQQQMHHQQQIHQQQMHQQQPQPPLRRYAAPRFNPFSAAPQRLLRQRQQL